MGGFDQCPDFFPLRYLLSATRLSLLPNVQPKLARITPLPYPASMYPLGRGFSCPNLKTITKNRRCESTGSEQRART